MITKGIIVIPTHGFGNRMRMLASTYIFSKYHNLTMFVNWNPATNCNIEFEDIFDNNDKLFRSIHSNNFKKSNYLYYGIKHTNEIIDNLIFVLKNKTIVYEYLILEGGHEFKQPDMTDSLFLFEKHKFYQSITFSPVINSKVTNFCLKHNPENMIGVHYRHIINDHDGLDVKNNEIVNFTKNSPLDKFIEVISKIQEKYKNVIFVSNNPESYHIFKRSLPTINFFHTNATTYDRNTTDSMIDSIVDFLILSKTKVIIGSFYSSFSDEAAFFNFIPKITPLSDKLSITKNVPYHCLNYSHSNIPSVNSNFQIFFEIFDKNIY